MKGVTIMVTPFVLFGVFIYDKYMNNMANKTIKTIEMNGVKYDLNSLPEGGENGQVLTKTEDSVKWSDNVNFWKGTLEEYNKIGNKDNDCIYFVVGNISDDE